MRQYTVGLSDRIVSAISYLTAGWGGLVFSVIMYFAKKRFSHFAKYNIFQSIFISLLFFCLSMAFGLIFKLLSYIPFLNYVVAYISFFLNRPFIFNYSIIESFMTGLIIYLCVQSLRGKYPRVYKISSIIDNASR